MKKFPAASSSESLNRGGLGGYLATLFAVALAYFVLAKLGLQLASINPSASPIWAPTGVALAAVILAGLRIWPAILIGAFAANAATAGTLETSAVIAVGNTLEGVVGGYLITRWCGGSGTFATPARIAKFAIVSVGLPTMLSATIGVATLYVAGLAAEPNLAPIWITWWLGDTAGALVVTPVIVLWAITDWRSIDWRELREMAAVFGCAILVGLVTFSPLLPRSQYTSPLGFLAILPLVWAALRRGPRDTATVGVILTIFAIWATIAQAGPFAHMGLNESFLLLLTFMLSVSVPSLALSADVEMRRRSEDDLRRIQAELDSRVKERTAALADTNVQLSKANTQLADANIQLSEAQRLANLGSWSWDVVHNRISWSDQLYDIYGLKPGEFGGTFADFITLIHPDDRAQVQASLTGALKSGGDFSHEERIIRRDGRLRHLHSVGEVIRDENGAAVRMLGVCLDVTERKEAETALRESEQNVRMLLTGLRDYAIYMLDIEGHVRSWNAGAEQIKGYSADEIVGQHFRTFYTDEDRAQNVPEHALTTAMREGKYEAESWLVRKDGTRFYANELIETIRDEAGELAGFAKITRDITAQHDAQVELDETREQLAQAQKMEALGQLTGGIAHDFNNLLMIVSGYAQILQRRLSEPKEVQAVEAIRAAAGRGEKLTRQLLTFSRRQQLMPVVVDLHSRIGVVRDMLAPSLRGNIELVVDIEDKIWPVEVDLGELELALVNIAVNARDAMPEGGTITLQARNVVLTPGTAAGSLEGDFVALAIIDTGTGISAEVLQRVFEPFYTTKPVGKGTGLGLSQVHGFANQSGGAVTVASEPGRGTVVTVYLPRARTEIPAEPGAGASVGRDQIQGTVLVVEDSRDVADVTSALLEQLGYRVVRAENATEALRHLQQGIEFNLLFSDIVMPGAMDGIGLAQACREQYPDLPVLLTSGFSDAAQAADGRFDILRKPFELSVLERAIEQVIGGGRARPRASAS
ncbi:MAG TPA: MASE1 domain-containing protein [Pseudolabrys sp.]|nr:MASE1 domain-containing protein [Pseudolabrys sp.]